MGQVGGPVPEDSSELAFAEKPKVRAYRCPDPRLRPTSFVRPDPPGYGIFAEAGLESVLSTPFESTAVTT